MSDNLIDNISTRMGKAIQSLSGEFSSLKSGRANASMLDSVSVEVYGSMMPISQVATISVIDPKMLSVQVWDANNSVSVDKAIRNSGLELNPIAEGAVIRVPVPQMTEERRIKMSKVAGKYAENSKVAVRNIRRDAMDTLKKQEKDGDLSKDEAKMLSSEVQKLTDKFVKDIDVMLSDKEKEMMTI